jgi:hypothetical protein
MKLSVSAVLMTFISVAPVTLATCAHQQHGWKFFQ